MLTNILTIVCGFFCMLPIILIIVMSVDAVDMMEKTTHQFHSEKINCDGWIPTTKNLPHEGVRVLGCIKSIHANAPYIDVVRVKMGISKSEREQLEKTGNERARFFTSSDEWGNNKVPYSWKTFGNIEYFGQEVVAWQPLPEPYSED